MESQQRVDKMISMLDMPFRTFDVVLLLLSDDLIFF